MTWTCRLFASRDAVLEAFGFIPVGAMWPAVYMVEGEHAHLYAKSFSAQYRAEFRAHRAPLVVMMPNGSDFCIDSAFWNQQDGYRGGWKVSGTAPQMTLEPSINIVGSYHGYLRDGVISDDCEGRTFPHARTFP